MANLEIEGVDTLIQAMNRLGEDTIDQVTTEMLQKGAAIVVQEWKKSCERHGHIRTGAMYKSIRATKIKKTDTGKSISIYPQGKDAKGNRNAEKAFRLNYGSSIKHGSHWVDDADKASEKQISREFDQIWNEKTKIE